MFGQSTRYEQNFIGQRRWLSLGCWLIHVGGGLKVRFSGAQDKGSRVFDLGPFRNIIETESDRDNLLEHFHSKHYFE